MVEGEEIKETLGGGLRAEVVHLTSIAAQAAEDTFGRVARDGNRPAFAQEHPLLLRTRQPTWNRRGAEFLIGLVPQNLKILSETAGTTCQVK